MDFLSAKELAAKWGVDPTRVHRLAREGRIPGATLFGRNWMFPADTPKPADRRTSSAKAAFSEASFRFPLYVNFDEKAYMPPLSPEELALRRGQKLFHACRFEEAGALLLPLSQNAKNRYVRLSALYHLCNIAVFGGGVGFDTALWRMNEELMQDFPYKQEMLLLRYGFDADNTYYGSLLEKFSVVPEYTYHPSAYYVVALAAFIPIENGNYSLMSKLRYDSQELLCQRMELDGYWLEAQKMHYLLSIVYQLQSDMRKMETHIRRGLTIAMEHGLYYVAAFYERWYRDISRKVLQSFPADFSNTITALGSNIQKKQLQFMESHDYPFYLGLLSDREFEFAFLANQDFTNREIAQKQHISEKTVSRVYNEIYDKLGVHSKAELVALINRTHSGQAE